MSSPELGRNEHKKCFSRSRFYKNCLCININAYYFKLKTIQDKNIQAYWMNFAQVKFEIICVSSSKLLNSLGCKPFWDHEYFAFEYEVITIPSISALSARLLSKPNMGPMALQQWHFYILEVYVLAVTFIYRISGVLKRYFFKAMYLQHQKARWERKTWTFECKTCEVGTTCLFSWLLPWYRVTRDYH